MTFTVRIQHGSADGGLSRARHQRPSSAATTTQNITSHDQPLRVTVQRERRGHNQRYANQEARVPAAGLVNDPGLLHSRRRHRQDTAVQAQHRFCASAQTPRRHRPDDGTNLSRRGPRDVQRPSNPSPGRARRLRAASDQQHRYANDRRDGSAGFSSPVVHRVTGDTTASPETPGDPPCHAAHDLLPHGRTVVRSRHRLPARRSQLHCRLGCTHGAAR